MNTHQMILALEVARRGGFAAVGRYRGHDPSSVSRAIGELEAELGLRLFQRSTRRLAPTAEGALWLARIEPLVEELERAGEMARDVALGTGGELRGLLRITASVTFGQARIVPLLAEFMKRHPGLQVEGVFTDANIDLVADRIDLAIRLGPAVSGDLIASKLMDTTYRVVASPAYLAKAPGLARPDDLMAHRVLLFDIAAFRSRWRFRDTAGAVSEVPVDGAITLSPAGSLLAAALAGLGPALLPDWLVDDDIAAGQLTDCFPALRCAAANFDTAAWLVYPSRAYLPSKVRAMIDFLREKLARSSAGTHVKT
jgi:DNA-binding transcriptional LysR family regulator